MKLNNLKPAEGSIKDRKRIGRGEGSGHGGTSTRGHKGAGSRSGNKRKIGFEGGQMPLQRRLPKFGFKSLNRVEYKGINLDTLQLLVDKHNLSEVTFDTLVANGICSKKALVKVMGRGELKGKLNVTAHAFTATAKAAIEAMGGTANII
ncbi:MAG: ribosomal protein [Bacteroidota bacterium]|jgi:large subunit ribosomal protein L15|nr:50S ribosomal protein L15 [Flavobacteriales bacterium]MDP4717937.1 50S ribosomal protein L15 [Flavobacteriales bacterium]MDP4732036.1 50S ribosomal protein L15 [Flavobacteriales bacterium]MDP4817468.1 50S ribosomal protein L15 [Flavobacteriales bacterium]MDP4950297.1 50S ribosomal protein L15 [Flavobacteriales bacterium]